MKYFALKSLFSLNAVRVFFVGVFLAIGATTISPVAVDAYNTNGQGASNAVGQTLPTGQINYSSSTVNNPMDVGVNSPAGAVVDAARHLAYLVDSNNSRVLVFRLNTDNTFPD